MCGIIAEFSTKIKKAGKKTKEEDIKAIQKQSRDSVQALMADFRAKRGEMGSVGRSSSTVAMANARAKMDDMSKQLMDMRKAETDKISAVLTADQKTKLTQLTETDMNNAIEKMKANAKSRPAQMNATQTKPAITQVKPVIGQKK